MSDIEEVDPNEPTNYDFEVPNTLVGLIIGIKGKTVKDIQSRSKAVIHVIPHWNANKMESHQIFRVEGKSRNTDYAINMFRTIFPADRFPELNKFSRIIYQHVRLPFINYNILKHIKLPSIHLFDIFISAVVDMQHFFIQLPGNPTFPLLEQFQQTVTDMYHKSAPPAECIITPNTLEKMMCVAPLKDKWYRAVSVKLDEKLDEMLVKFVDYGGYTKLPVKELRFVVREDIMELPFQATECHLAFVEPLHGKAWTDEARKCFYNICMKKIIKAKLIGHHQVDGLPYIRLFIPNKKNELIIFDEWLIKQKLGKPWNDTNCVFLENIDHNLKKPCNGVNESQNENNLNPIFTINEE